MTDRRFRTLRVVAALLKALAGVLLVGGSSTGITLIINPLWLTTRATATGIAIQQTVWSVAAGAVILAISVVGGLLLYVIGEAANVLIAIEEHTRDSARLVGRMWAVFGPPPKAFTATESQELSLGRGDMGQGEDL